MMVALRPDLEIISQWIKPRCRVLDLGCGDGTLLRHLRETKQVESYGLEIDDENITRCIQSRVNVLQMNIDSGLSDFDADSFDYVVMSQTLQAMQHPDKILDEMLRVGREGIVTFPNFGHWLNRLQITFGGRMPQSRVLPERWYSTPNIHLCTLNDFEQLCREKDIEILQRTVVNFAHRTSPLMHLLPNLFAEIALYRFQKKWE